MKFNSLVALVALCVCEMVMPRSAFAQFAVIDAASLAQLISQYEVMQQQVTLALQTYSTMTGDRGMSQLLSGTNRNYLPTSWAGISSAMQGGNGGGDLGGSIQSIVNTNAVLSAQNVSRLSPNEQAMLNTQRQVTALLQALTRTAIGTTSTRFSSLQQLTNAIPTAKDSKAALDLQARVSSENTMMINDSSKLQALYTTAQAERWAVQQKQSEQAIQDIGSLRTLPPMGLH
jgi:type IV secretion system protein VirB5